MDLNEYELAWLVKERLRQDREFAARQALIKEARADRPALRVRLGVLLIRLGGWLQGEAESDTEAERVTP